MRMRISLIILAVPLLMLAGCSSDDESTPPTTPPSDQSVLDAGWAAYEAGDYAGAETEFRELLGRQALVAEAHDGLGWNFAGLGEADSALAHHQQSLAQGGDELPIADQMHAGLAYALSADNQHAECITAADEVSTDWVFAHDETLDHDDVVALQASAHYVLGQFAESLLAVQQVDATFDCDVATVEGRAELAAKIESLLT